MTKYLSHPVWNVAMFVFLVGILITGFTAANNLENSVKANTSDIKHDKESSDAKDVALADGIKDLKQDTKDIKSLLNQLILREE